MKPNNGDNTIPVFYSQIFILHEIHIDDIFDGENSGAAINFAGRRGETSDQSHRHQNECTSRQIHLQFELWIKKY